MGGDSHVILGPRERAASNSVVFRVLQAALGKGDSEGIVYVIQ